MPLRRVLYMMIGFWLMAGSALMAEGDVVTIKILAVNPTLNAMDAIVRHPLPPEIKPEHIVDSAGMDVKYDQNKLSFYLISTVALAPRETRTIEVRVKNVWTVPDEEIEETREKLTQTLASLEGTKYFETGKQLLEKALAELDTIQEEQSQTMGIRRKILLYRANKQRFDRTRTDYLSLGALRQLAGQGDAELRTVKFIIRAQNPSDKAATMQVQGHLPNGIKPDDVLDDQGFQVLYDDEREKFMLSKEDDFAPKEEKKYVVVLRDIWFIPKSELDFLRDQAENVAKRFEDGEFAKFAKASYKYIVGLLDSVWTLQQEVADSLVIEDRIRAFVINHQRIELVKKKIKELQDLLLEVPARQITEVDQIREAVKNMSKILDVLSLGFTPDLSTTWWIILGIIAFLFVFSAVFYVVWLVKLPQNKFQKAAAAESKSEPETPEGEETG